MAVTPVQFGSYDPSDPASVDSTGDIQVTCDSAATYLSKLGLGLNSGGDFNNRKMTSSGGSTPLSYNLYRDATHTEVWGDGTVGFPGQPGSGTAGVAVHYTIYGRIPGGQNVGVGSYSDLLTVTIEW